MAKRLILIDVAALGYELLERHGRLHMAGLTFRPAETVFPAVTCPVQASMRTAMAPAEHGMVANGVFCRELNRPMFWEQSSRLVAGERIWSGYRARGGKVGMLFWQQSMGEEVDVLLTPAPIHKHHGGMIEDVYSQPPGLYRGLVDGLDWPFTLRSYWGPLASTKSGDWIADAAHCLLADPRLAPDLCLVYLPTLDYDLQRHGPGGEKAARALDRAAWQIERIAHAARDCHHEVIVFGDYAMAEVTRPAVLPNLALREAGLLQTRKVRRMLYPDLPASRAFAMVDHEVAHVYVPASEDVPAVREVLAGLDGIAEVFDPHDPAERKRGLAHARSGELVAVAEPGAWLAYPWWTANRQAPEFAAHVDIHNKPGYDPCELFFGWPPMSVSRDVSKVRGTHGRAGPDRQVAWASTTDLPAAPGTLLDLAAAIRHYLSET